MRLRTLATTALAGSAIALFAASAPSAWAQTPPTVSVTASPTSIEVPGSFTATADFVVPPSQPGFTSATINLFFGTDAAVTVALPTVTALQGPEPTGCRFAPNGRDYLCDIAFSSNGQNGQYRMTANVTVSSLLVARQVTVGGSVIGVPAQGVTTNPNLALQTTSVALSESTTTTSTPPDTSTTAAPTTAAPTTAPPTTAAPVTTTGPASGAGTLPATGPDDVSWVIVVLAVMALAGGGVAVRLARRTQN